MIGIYSLSVLDRMFGFPQSTHTPEQKRSEAGNAAVRARPLKASGASLLRIDFEGNPTFVTQDIPVGCNQHKKSNNLVA